MALDIETFYERYGPMVMRRCRALLRDEAKAQDGRDLDLGPGFLEFVEHSDATTVRIFPGLLLGLQI